MTENELREVLQRAGISGSVTTCILEEYRHYTETTVVSDGLETWVSIADQDTVEMENTKGIIDDPVFLTRQHDILSNIRGEKKYESIGLLGEGGMGEVRRMHESKLSRHVAMKVIHHHFMGSRNVLARFIEEAQVCAQLEHPNIIPIYDVGVLDNGKVYYTMREIKGDAFSKQIEQLHNGIQDNIWPETGVTLTQVLLQFLEVCEGMAYAHDKGVVHRDLKPENIMIGGFGEVLIVDWGLVKLFTSNNPSRDKDIVTIRSQGDSQKTMIGQVAGTPAYMAPEQADGRVDLIDHRTDIYALGAILYEILSGRAPYVGLSGLDILEQVRTKPPLPLSAMFRQSSVEVEEYTDQSFDHLIEQIRSAPLLPKPLVEMCERAMARDREDRYQNTIELVQDLQSYLDGSKKREQAQSVVSKAQVLGRDVQTLTEQYQQIQHQIEETTVETWASVEDKTGLWELEEQSFHLLQQIREMEGEQEYLLRAAFTHFPSCVSAHRELAALYKIWHCRAEAERSERAGQLLRSLERHAQFLPSSEAESLLDYIEGKGTVSLYLENNPAVSIVIEHYVERDKRLQPERILDFHTFLIEEQVLDRGSYRFVIEVILDDDSFQLYLPFVINRMQHTVLGRKGNPLPLVNPEGECYVAKSEGIIGGDDLAMNGLSQRLQVLEGFIIQKYHVTNREYIAFLNDLVDHGKEVEALFYAPKRGDQQSNQTLYERNEEGYFLPSALQESELAGWDWPVCFVDWNCCQRYSEWYSERTGRLWRLPTELEWERAARGVDGRIYPWGDSFDFAFCCLEESQEEPSPVNVTDFELDESPYGVRHMAGNMSEWTASPWEPEDADQEFDCDPDEDRVIRGGYWCDYPRRARSSCRDDGSVSFRDNYLGFRLVRPILK